MKRTMKVSVTPISAKPPAKGASGIIIFHVVIEGETADWHETMGSAYDVSRFFRGLQSMWSMLGHGTLNVPKLDPLGPTEAETEWEEEKEESAGEEVA